MGSYSAWHWIIILIWLLIPLFPLSEILRKAGFSRAWALLWFVPVVNLVAVVVFAYSRWPSLEKSA
ncbi:hypothetical protein [Brevundimonas sp.]|uniref:hypothetical protein n=1 Tax=Brevundimonas sp. TaxID=1871086 RepID=UPI002FC74965